MKPFYRDPLVTLYRDRWEAILPLLVSGSFDALITDSPYGTTQLDWDKPVDWRRFWPLIYRLCKPSAVQVLFSAQPFTTDLINSNRANYRYELIWEKTVASRFFDVNRRPLQAHEAVQIFAAAPISTTYNPQKWMSITKAHNSKGGISRHYDPDRKRLQYEGSFERHPTTVLPQFSNGNGGKSNHETAKPLELMMWLVATYTNPGDLVLDPFVGSGSTAEACKKLGRRCIGIEMREQPLQIAAWRVSQEAMEVA